MKLEGKVSLVTGASRGIGKAIALKLTNLGSKVAVNYHEGEVEANRLVWEITSRGGEAISIKADVADSEAVKDMVRKVTDKWGQEVDILVNNAGIYPYTPFAEMPDAIRDRVIDINIKGVWNCTKAVIPGMIKQRYGKIINISSVTGPMVSARGDLIYSASKGAVSGFTRGLALEVAEYGINVNAICPGYVDTPGMRRMASEMGMDPDEYLGKLSKSIPLGRLGSIEEIGDLAAFLASEESKYITGAEIVIDGGNIIQEEKS